MCKHFLTTPWGSITEWLPGHYSTTTAGTTVDASDDWRLVLEIPKRPWNHQATFVEIEARGPNYRAHLLKIQAGPDKSILVSMDRHVIRDPDDYPHTGGVSKPKLFQWEENQDGEDCVRLIIFKHRTYLGTKQAGNGQIFTATLGNGINRSADLMDLQLGAGFTWGMVETKWCKAPRVTAEWKWPLEAMALPRSSFRLEASEGRRNILLYDEATETCMMTFPAHTLSILDIKKTIMALRTNLHGRPLAIIREEDTVNGDPGNTYDIPVMGFEWSKLIDFRPRMGGSGRKLLYLHLMFSEVGSLAPYHCRECEQEVSAAGGTCDLCSRFLASTHIKVF